MNKIKYLSAPVFVWWNVTYLCNLRCRQCYSNSGRMAPNELTTDEAKRLVEQLAKMKVFYIYFLGGEPLMRKDFLELATHAHNLGLALVMSTNGWFVTSKTAADLEKVGFSHVRVSVDGAKAETHDAIRGIKGCFKKAINAVKILRETRIPRIGISPTVLAENVEEMPYLIELAERLRVDEMQLVQLCARGRGVDAKSASVEQLLRLRKIFDDYQKKLTGKINLTATEGISWDGMKADFKSDLSLPNFWGCPAGRTCLAVEAEGTIKPCILFNKAAGNVRRSSLETIWHRSRLFQKMRTPPAVCGDCNFVEFCSGECPIDSCADKFFRRSFIECDRRKGGNSDVGSRKKE